MTRLISIHGAGDSASAPLAAIGLFVAVSALLALCVKHSRRATTNHSPEPTHDPKPLPPRSPLPSPRRMITAISNKALPFVHGKKSGEIFGEGTGRKTEEGYGEGGLWQKGILMGEKCQPPEFSGVILYDCYGNRISELPPRSPRTCPSPAHGFSFPPAKDAQFQIS